MKDDWSWKPKPEDIPVKQKKSFKKVNKTQHAKKKVLKFLKANHRSSSGTWTSMAHQLSQIIKIPWGRGKNDARQYIMDWARLSNEKTKRAKPTKTKFYQSWEWKKLRYEAIKRYGPICMCCGSDYRIVVDHIKPRRLYPELELDPDNVQILCNDCNMGKSYDDETDFRPKGDDLGYSDFSELTLVKDLDDRI